MNWKNNNLKAGEEALIKKIGLLIVDDEEEIVLSFTEILKKYFTVYSTSEVTEALQIFKEKRPKIIISDQRMPEIKGLDFLEEIKKTDPATIRILISGFSDIEVLIKAVNNGLLYKYIEKPCDTKELINATIEGAKYYIKNSGLTEQHKDILELKEYEFENYTW